MNNVWRHIRKRMTDKLSGEIASYDNLHSWAVIKKEVSDKIPYQNMNQIITNLRDILNE